MVAKRNPPKNHKFVRQSIGLADIFEGLSPQTACEIFLQKVEDTEIINPILEFDYEEIYISGFKPMTEAEIKKFKIRSEQAKLAAAKKKEKKEQLEQEQLKKLAAKYPSIIKEID